MQSTGHTATQAVSTQSRQSRVMMYAIVPPLPRCLSPPGRLVHLMQIVEPADQAARIGDVADGDLREIAPERFLRAAPDVPLAAHGCEAAVGLFILDALHQTQRALATFVHVAHVDPFR